MNRKPSPIPTLIAARVRPVRRAPGSAHRAPVVGGLRLRINEEAPPEPPKATAAVQTLHIEQAQQVAAAMRIADSALGEIHARLAALEGMLPATRGVRRLSPQVIVALQVEIDSMLEFVEQLVDSTVSDGRRLLDGGWTATILDATGSIPRSIGIESMRPKALGSSAPGFLSSIAERGTNALRGGRAALARSIIRAATEQIRRRREIIAEFLESAIRPLLAAGEVLAENVAAQVNAFNDPLFAVESSQVSRSDALLSAILSKPAASTPPAEKKTCGMRLVRE